MGAAKTTQTASVKAQSPRAASPFTPRPFHASDEGIQLKSQKSINRPSLIIQPKITVGPANDKYEQEADQMAHQVVNTPIPVQRRVEDKDELQRTMIQPFANAGFEVDGDFEHHLTEHNGGGSPLPSALRANFEPKFGANFSQVRIHTDEPSDQLNQSIQARAFTSGNDIYFRKGEYNPASSAGKALLAHELTHTLQQTGGEHALRVGIAAHPNLNRRETGRRGGGGTLQRFAPADNEVAPTNAALDNLLEVGQDPGACRAPITAASPSLVSLHGAVVSIVARVPVPAQRRRMAQDVRNVEELDQLLMAATSHVGAGSPGPRLISVLGENHPPFTMAALGGRITARLQIDEKILRGRLPNPLGHNVAPVAGSRDIIGGHSQEVLQRPATFAVGPQVVNPNQTVSATYKKVARGDVAGTIAAVNNNTPGNVIQNFENRAAVGSQWINHPPDFTPGFKNAAAHVLAASTLRRNNAIAPNGPGPVAIGQFNNAVVGARNAAAAFVAAGDINHATLMKPFVDRVEDARASAMAILVAADDLLSIPGITTTAPNRLAVNQARQGVIADFLAFETVGPILANKGAPHTIAPAGMTEDQMLGLKDQVAALPATLIRLHPHNNPVNGDLISTKHQQLVNGILWVAIKDNVTYTNNGGNIALNGGHVTSFFPTQFNAVPADPMPPNVDTDGFTHIH